MGVYLRDHPPARSQYRSPRRAKPTGLVVVHTAESVMDTVGPDTGAENVAAFIQRRTNAGSYHDLVDSDSAIQLVEYGDEAYQDGTGSNPYALSISFALSAADWPRLSTARRDAFLAQGARAFARQQAWLRAHGYPTTSLRRVTRAQSDAGVAGFISHAERDPSRRTDPGREFPWAEFLDHCRTADEGDDMSAADVLEIKRYIDDVANALRVNLRADIDARLAPIREKLEAVDVELDKVRHQNDAIGSNVALQKTLLEVRDKLE